MPQDVNLKTREDKNKLEKLDFDAIANAGVETTQAATNFGVPPMSVEALEKTVLDYDVYPKLEVVGVGDIFSTTGKYGTTESIFVRFKPMEPIAKGYAQKIEEFKETVNGEEKTKSKWAVDDRNQPNLYDVEDYTDEIGVYFKLGNVDKVEILRRPSTVDENGKEIPGEPILDSKDNPIEYYLITNRMKSYPFLRAVAQRKGLIDPDDHTSSIKFYKNLVLEIEGIQVQVDFAPSPASKKLRIGGKQFKLLN